MSLQTNISNVIVRIATEFKAQKTLINGNAANLSALTTTTKANLVAAINEVLEVAKAATGGEPGMTEGQVQTLIDNSVASLVGGSGAALDTLKELADALGGDANFSTTITNLIATKANDADVVKLTGNQTIAGVKTFSAAPAVPDGSFTQAKVTGLTAALAAKADAAAVGDTDANFVPIFESGLV